MALQKFEELMIHEQPTETGSKNQKLEFEKPPDKSRQRKERKKKSSSSLENTAIPLIDAKRKIQSIHTIRMIKNHI